MKDVKMLMEEDRACCGVFFPMVGVFVLGLASGGALGMTYAPSRREMRKIARETSKHVSELLEDMKETMQQYL